MQNNISSNASIKERINRDLITALKGKDKVKALVLRSLNAAIKNSEIVKRAKISKGAEEGQEAGASSSLNDEEIIGVIASQIKQRRDSIAEFEKGNRADLADKEKAELDILMQYMPAQMSEEEIREAVKSAIGKTGATSVKEMGKVMAELMKDVKGRADGTLVSKIVKESLSK